jgi:hypothetical protein
LLERSGFEVVGQAGRRRDATERACTQASVRVGPYRGRRADLIRFARRAAATRPGQVSRRSSRRPRRVREMRDGVARLADEPRPKRAQLLAAIGTATMPVLLGRLMWPTRPLTSCRRGRAWRWSWPGSANWRQHALLTPAHAWRARQAAHLVLLAVRLGTSGPARQLLYVTGRVWKHDKSLRRYRSTAIPGRSLKSQVGRVGLEPTTGGL